MKHLFWTKWGFHWRDIKLETRWGRDGDRAEPYQTVLSVGRLRLHCFHRGDHDPDAHDHMWDFKTFPFTSYLEEVTEKGQLRQNLVQRLRWHHRPAEYAHRVLHRVGGSGRIWTFVIVGKKRRDWGFHVRIVMPVYAGLSRVPHHVKTWRWVPWREYIYGEKNDTSEKT